jgi:hypothetical protein
MSADLMNMLWNQISKMADYVQRVNLQLQKLRWTPPSDNRVIFLGNIQVDQQALQEVLLNNNLARLGIIWVVAHMEDLGP